MAMLRLAPPWITYVSELQQMFKYDGQVHVVYDNDENEVKLYVDSATKAGALQELLPETKDYGNVIRKITVVPANGFGISITPTENLYAAAFRGNGAFSFVKQVQGIFSNSLTYVVFKNKVVQYFNDNLGDIYGQCSTLYQEIAKNIFLPKEGVYYCTDVEEPVFTGEAPLGGPLGEWP